MQRYAARATSDWQRPGLRHRAGVLGLTLLVELVFVLIVIAFGGSKVRDAILPSSPTQIVFVPNPAAPPPSPPQQRRAAEKAPPRPTPPARVPKPPPPVLPRAALPYIPMSKLDLAASDISKLGTAAGAPAATSGAAAGTGAAVGAGPGGVTLYNAEWVVEPSDAQLRTFLPRTVEAGSWALIACQTIAHNQVENCAQLGESPRGSGLAKAMRLAAWQFRVRPPRIDGKPMVGAWVRIRIDFGQAKGE
jgi:protein TonB